MIEYQNCVVQCGIATVTQNRELHLEIFIELHYLVALALTHDFPLILPTVNIFLNSSMRIEKYQKYFLLHRKEDF